MLGARKGPSENKGRSTIVFSVYCLNKYMEGQWKNFCSAPAALGQNMLIADGVAEVSPQTLVRPYLTHRVETLSCKSVHVYVEMSKATFPMIHAAPISVNCLLQRLEELLLFKHSLPQSVDAV